MVTMRFVALAASVGAVVLATALFWFTFFRARAHYTEHVKAINCTISINEDLTNPQPLLLKPNSPDRDPFYLPEDPSGTVRFRSGQVVHLACPGSGLVIEGVETQLPVASARCVGGKSFVVAGELVRLSALNCSEHPSHVARYNGRTCAEGCGDACKEIEIGFQIDSRFLPHILVCFNETSQIAVYSHSNITRHIRGKQSASGRPFFKQGGFYRLTGVDGLYARTKQRETINELLGLPENDTTYVHGNDSFFLSRGHLTAMSDFVYEPQQRLTFYYVNAAPQWLTFNGGNWRALEGAVRSYAADNGLDLVVYTGTHGVAALPHNRTGRPTPLHLYVDRNGNAALPVPELFWKFVYEPQGRAGAVFVGVNNPYRKAAAPICADVSDAIGWLKWEKDDRVKGYSYACEVEEFARVVKHLPRYDVKGLLT